MKKTTLISLLISVSLLSLAQNTQSAAWAAAAALAAAEDTPEKVEKPTYWTHTVIMNMNFGQTYLSQWVAGGYNNVSLAGNVDVSAVYAREKLKGANRAQMDYAFLYSADKPILQNTKDRVYLESIWSYDSFIKNLAYSASFDFKTQFYNNYAYGTPSTRNDADGNVIEPSVKDWLEARTLKSGFFAPAYLNIGMGAKWTPAPWITLNVAPLSGGGVFVTIPELRKTYGMDLVEGSSTDYQAFRTEFGAQLKLDMAWVINRTFSYATQGTLFYNYLTPRMEPRLTWDNKIVWKMGKYFALNLTTNLIYDPRVLVRDKDKDGKVDSKGVQFREYVEFGFTYTIIRKR